MRIIEVADLTKVYGRGEAAVSALDHVNMSVDRGEFVAVMGPSGCGKSTLLHLVGALDRASSGIVRLEGRELSSMSDDELTELRRRRLGFVFQFFNLIPVLTALDNAALPLVLDGHAQAAAREKAAAWLERMGMGKRTHHVPDQLSAGQQQRVALARALVTDPLAILADEPTGNLDTRGADEITGILRGLANDGRTVLMVTHDPRLAAYADRIVFLKDGRIVDESRLTGDRAREGQMAREKVASL